MIQVSFLLDQMVILLQNRKIITGKRDNQHGDSFVYEKLQQEKFKENISNNNCNHLYIYTNINNVWGKFQLSNSTLDSIASHKDIGI